MVTGADSAERGRRDTPWTVRQFIAGQHRDKQPYTLIFTLKEQFRVTNYVTNYILTSVHPFYPFWDKGAPTERGVGHTP